MSFRCDEPTGNLDSKSSAEVFELMRRFNRELGTTFLVVTHDPRIAGRCDRTLEIIDGRIVKDGRLDEPQAVRPLVLPEQRRHLGLGPKAHLARPCGARRGSPSLH